ncbi:serine hydrolase domain-containing protein [uncultured Algimonas sp.]|uniref:serine hydrolase domain-containing protein n=1 Tax=uncultured Algimonas sp. TaxID=1547920 RepID=UPI0026322675|nr:serine hydrolase domain-containing protein [uncultured Algimonas sp.]
MTERMDADGIPGAVIALVGPEDAVTLRGFGLAVMDPSVPADPETSLFRLGSVSKTFIYVIALQLVESDQLDLDAPIARYAGADLTGAGPEDAGPTVREVLTHTAGFEERYSNVIADAPMRTEKYLRGSPVPDRRQNADKVPAYSNYGASLVALACEAVTGTDFASLAKERIFEPLGMDNTSFDQSAARQEDPNQAVGYQAGQAQPFEILGPYAAGGASSTAADMASFMADLLAEDPILMSSETRDLMLSRQVAMHPDLPGMALGFYEESRAGIRAVGHGGATFHFLTNMILFPDTGIGLFVSMNGGAAGRAIQRDLVWSIIDTHLAPRVGTERSLRPQTIPDADRPPSGPYALSRRYFDGPGRLLETLTQADVEVSEDGILTISSLRGNDGVPRRFVYSGDGLFRAQNDRRIRLAVWQGDDGTWRLAGDDLRPIQVLEHRPWHRSKHTAKTLQTVAKAGLGVGFGLLVVLVGLMWRSFRSLAVRDVVLTGVVGIGVLSAFSGLFLWAEWAAMVTTELDGFNSTFRPRLRLMQLVSGFSLIGPVASIILIGRSLFLRSADKGEIVSWNAALVTALSFILAGFAAFAAYGWMHDLFDLSLAL